MGIGESEADLARIQQLCAAVYQSAHQVNDVEVCYQCVGQLDKCSSQPFFTIFHCHSSGSLTGGSAPVTRTPFVRGHCRAYRSRTTTTWHNRPKKSRAVEPDR